MKKLLALLLALVLVLCVALIPYAMAEAAEAPPAPVPMVDLTSAFVAVLLLVFDFLLTWIAKVIVPPIKQWLLARTSEKQRNLLWDAICKLVDAAEQTIRGPGRGEERLDYVIDGLHERGFKVDKDLIEAAVKRMNDRTLATISEAFIDQPEDDQPEGDQS